jgi:hypothetical protein
MGLLRIKDWRDTFYVAEAFRYERVTWTRFPVSTDSIRFRRLMRTREGREAYCVFVACVQLSARAKAMGALLVGETPLDCQDIASATGIPPKVVEASIALLASAEIGWLVPVRPGDPPVPEPGDARDETGQRPGEQRDWPGQRPGLAPARAHASAKSNALPIDVVVSDSNEQGELCSMLVALRFKGTPLFDRDAAAAIAKHPNVSRMQYAWVLEVMNSRAKDTEMANPAGYFRSMLETKTPPSSWTEKYRRRELAKLAAQAAGGVA